jgi:hypothetical protein
MKNNKILEILNGVKIGILTSEEALDKILSIIEESIENKKEIDEPILIGYLNRSFGYNNCDPVLIGTPVFYFNDRYFFNLKNSQTGKESIIRFYTEDLYDCINFI